MIGRLFQLLDLHTGGICRRAKRFKSEISAGHAFGPAQSLEHLPAISERASKVFLPGECLCSTRRGVELVEPLDSFPGRRKIVGILSGVPGDIVEFRFRAVELEGDEIARQILAGFGQQHGAGAQVPSFFIKGGFDVGYDVAGFRKHLPQGAEQHFGLPQTRPVQEKSFQVARAFPSSGEPLGHVVLESIAKLDHRVIVAQDFGGCFPLAEQRFMREPQLVLAIHRQQPGVEQTLDQTAQCWRRFPVGLCDPSQEQGSIRVLPSQAKKKRTQLLAGVLVEFPQHTFGVSSDRSREAADLVVGGESEHQSFLIALSEELIEGHLQQRQRVWARLADVVQQDIAKVARSSRRVLVKQACRFYGPPDNFGEIRRQNIS